MPGPPLTEPWRSLLAQPGTHLKDVRDGLRALQDACIDELDDDALLGLLQENGLQPLPLLGRKAAVSGSARKTYPIDEARQPLLGIGDAVAQAMLLLGAEVVVNSEHPDICPSRLAYLRSLGRRCEYVQADLSTEDGARSFVQESATRLGGLDVLVLNAGTYGEPPIEDFNYPAAKKIFDLNVAGPMAAVSEYIRTHGQTARRGRIILTSSVKARLSETRHGLYDGSKAWLEAFLRSVSLDLAQRGHDIRINAVAPGLHHTPLTHEAIHADPHAARLFDGLIPLGVGDAFGVVLPYLLLAMAANDYMTGTVVEVSGGLSGCQMFPEGLSAPDAG